MKSLFAKSLFMYFINMKSLFAQNKTKEILVAMGLYMKKLTSTQIFLRSSQSLNTISNESHKNHI